MIHSADRVLSFFFIFTLPALISYSIISFPSLFSGGAGLCGWLDRPWRVITGAIRWLDWPRLFVGRASEWFAELLLRSTDVGFVIRGVALAVVGY